MNFHFYLLSIIVFTSISRKSDGLFMEEPRTEIEYQPIGEVERKEINESSASEVSNNPLPAEPEHAQVVSTEHVTNIDPSKTSMPASASIQLPGVPPVSGRPPGSEKEPLPPPSIEPEPPVVQQPQPPVPLTAASTSTTAGCHKVMDLGILMDSSHYISPSLWEEEKSIVVTLMDKLDITLLGTHMSVMTLSSEVEFRIPFNGYRDKVDLKRKIAELPYNYHSELSRVDLGLSAVKERMFDPRVGVRAKVPRALLMFTNGLTDGSQSAKILQAVDDLKVAQIKVIYVKLGNVTNQDFLTTARKNSLVFSENDIDGLSGALLDTCVEICSSEKSTKPVTLAASVPPLAPTPSPWPATQPAPAPYPAPIQQPLVQCPIPGCSFPLVCVQASIYATCVPPPNPSASTNNSCSTPGPCLTTVTKTATDTKTLVSTSTQTETSTAIATITNTKITTNTALTTQTHTQTDVVTATSTLTTTNTQVATSTHHTTETSTAVTTSHLPVTSTKTLTATSTRIVNTTDTHTLTTTDVIRTTATSTNIVTRTANKTNTHTLTTTKTDTVTSTGITTNTLLTTATATNTVNTTHLATKTLTETLTTVATQTSTSTYNATNVITATTTSTATATSTAVLTATSTAKTTETLTATSTAVLTQTLTNTHNQTLTKTKTLTATSTSVVTTCSASCLTVVPTTTPLPPTPPTPKPPVCEQALDIGVIIDASESVKLPNYKLCLQFVANLTEHFKVSQKGTHFGSIVYSSDAELQFSFKDVQYHDAESLKKKIKSFPYLREGTRTDIALELANTLLFSVQGGDRFDKPDVLIVITDGLTDPERSKPYPVVLKPLEDKKVVVIAVGVGKEVNKPELTSIAMGDVNHVFMVDQYTDLVKIINALLDKSCSAATQPKMVPSKAVALVKNQEHYDGECPVQFIKKGCFNAIKSQKPLPRLMFTDLDARDSKFSGVPIDWGSWNSYLQNVVCRCAQVSKAEGFYYFGVKNFGECWSGENLDITYSKDDSSEFCISKEFAECDTNDRNVCGGNATTTYIYRMPKESEVKQGKRCFTKFKNVGCFADMQTSSRPIPELIFTDLDESSTKYSGHKAQLGELDTYLSDLLCRCAELTQELGYEYFGLQNHGECYSGPSVQHTYSKDGSSKKCITRNFKQCPAGKKYQNKDGQDYCVGAQGANYVYRV